MINITVVDAYLSENGHFCLLDWLLKENILPYTAYEAWRAQQLDTLEHSFSVAEVDLIKWSEQCEHVCAQLKLTEQPHSYYAWQGFGDVELSICRSTVLQKSLGRRWVRPQDVPQLDLFMDNSAVVIENALLDQFHYGRFDRAQASLTQLISNNASHAKLGAYQDLINYGIHMTTHPEVDASQLEAEFFGLKDEVVPLAKASLGTAARDFLAKAWRRLANGLNEIPFDPERSDFHQYYALRQIPDWQGLQDILVDEKQLYHSANLLHQLAMAYVMTHQHALALCTWGVMMELFEEAGMANIHQCPSSIKTLWEDFLDYDEEWPASYFLGFLLVQQPAIAKRFAHLPTHSSTLPVCPENKAVLDLVLARLAEEHEMTLRAQLKSLSPKLFSCYMNKRDWYRSTAMTAKRS